MHNKLMSIFRMFTVVLHVRLIHFKCKTVKVDQSNMQFNKLTIACSMVVAASAVSKLNQKAKLFDNRLYTNKDDFGCCSLLLIMLG